MSQAKENAPQGRTDEPLLARKSDNEETHAQSSFEKEEKSSGNKWSILFLVAVSLARVAMGIFNSITGPTLPVLAQHVCKSPTTVSWIFSGRSVGFLIGSALSSVFDRFGISQMLMLSLSVLFCAVGLALMPILTDLWLLIIIVTITGIIAGYIDAAIQCIMLKVWGSKKSASILQLHHFTFSIGAFLAPILVSPFYSGDDDICSDSVDDNNEPVCLGIGDNNSILTPFLISSAFIAAVFFLMIWLYFVDITEKIKEDNQESADEREEDSIRDLWQYFIPVILFYFCIVSGENVYQSNIFSYAACKVGWESGKASILNSIFWAGFGIGRGSGIFFSRFLRPSTYIIIDLVFCAATATFLSIFPTNEIMLWIGSFTYGLGIATLYSCGISYSHELTNVSGKWIVAFGIGNAIGAMSMPILGTALVFDSGKPESLMYLLAGLTGLNILAFAGMHLFGNIFGSLPRLRREKDKKEHTF